jgi:hypothetical protein
MKQANKNGLIVLAVVALGGYFIYKNMKKTDNGGGGGGNTGGSGTGGGTTTGGVSNLNFTQMADDLFNAFNGWGTRNTVVFSTLLMLNNQADFDKLVEVYGVRKVSSGSGNIFANDFNGGLVETIKDEMSSSEIQKINDQFVAKGIKNI